MTLDPDAFDRDRPRLFSIAYRMVGVAADAEELVQETWVRLHERGVAPDDPSAYATRVLTRQKSWWRNEESRLAFVACSMRISMPISMP